MGNQSNKMRVPTVSLEDALRVLNACEPAIRWVKKQRCAKASSVLARLVRLGRRHSGEAHYLWLMWLRNVLSIHSPTNQIVPASLVRHRMINRVVTELKEHPHLLAPPPVASTCRRDLQRHKAAVNISKALRAHGYPV